MKRVSCHKKELQLSLVIGNSSHLSPVAQEINQGLFGSIQQPNETD
ncbi:hypothetical protein VCRA2127O344_120081 [Vibrio crassostreae]|nr:hypothetical protein VCRA2127O344_120081 [Vibrio crassostreae]